MWQLGYSEFVECVVAWANHFDKVRTTRHQPSLTRNEVSPSLCPALSQIEATFWPLLAEKSIDERYRDE